MALFGSTGKRALLAKLRKRDWKDPNELQEVFTELNGQDIKAGEVVWMLHDSDRNLRYYGSWLIHQQQRNMGDLHRVVLAELKDAKSVGRNYLIAALVEQSDPRLFRELDKMLEAKAREARSLAIDILLAHPTERVGKYLLQLLRHEEREYRWRALQKIMADLPEGKAPDARLRKLFVSMTRDEDERIRIRALQQLAKFPDTDVAEVLIDRLVHDNYGVKNAVIPLIEGLERVPGFNLLDRVLELLSHGDDMVRRTALSLALKQGNPRDILVRILHLQKDLVGWMRDRIIRTVQQSGTDMLPPITQLLRDRDRDTRLRALLFATNLEDKRLLPPVVELLSHERDWWIKMIAMDLLGRLGDESCVPALTACLDDNEVKWSAVEALSRIGGPTAMRTVVTLLRDPLPEVRLQVIAALEAHDDVRALPLLENLMQTDGELEVRERAMEAFKAISANHKRMVDEAELRKKFAYGQVDSLLDRLLVEVRRSGASDLHIISGWYPEMRVHGELKRIGDTKLRPRDAEKFLMETLTDRQQATFGKERQLDYCYVIPGVGRYRANMLTDRKGVGAVFRTIPNEVPTFGTTRLPSHLRDIANLNQGIVVISGRTGAGKSTTMAALINLINDTRRHHILTVEDPIEFVHSYKNSLVNQREVVKHTETFAAALRAALREDPDVIVIGEMRDPETMALALTAAETGHLVLATMHTTRAITTVDRLIEAFPPREQAQVRNMLSESLKVVINQNLAPNVEGTGRVAYHEILMGTAPVRALIRDGNTQLAHQMMVIGKEMGMQTVDMALRELLDERLIRPETAYLRAEDKASFEQYVSDAFLQGMS